MCSACRNLQAENAKLRELLSELYESAWLEYPSAFEHTFGERLRELGIEVGHCTPEQAIEATMGRGECRDEGCGTIAFKCSECGCWMLYDEYQEANLYAWMDDGIRPIFPRYCPNCGRKVVLHSS